MEQTRGGARRALAPTRHAPRPRTPRTPRRVFVCARALPPRPCAGVTFVCICLCNECARVPTTVSSHGFTNNQLTIWKCARPPPSPSHSSRCVCARPASRVSSRPAEAISRRRASAVTQFALGPITVRWLTNDLLRDAPSAGPTSHLTSHTGLCPGMVPYPGVVFRI